MTPRLFCACAALFFLAACGNADPAAGPSAKPGGKPAAKPEPAATNRIPIPATVRANLGLTFAKVEFRQIAATRRYPGRFEVDADARHEYRAPVAGVVVPLVQPYQRVQVGEPLLRLSGREWANLQREWRESRHNQWAADDASAVEARTARRRLLDAQIAAAVGLAVDDPRLEALLESTALTIHARAAGIVEPALPAPGAWIAAESRMLATMDPTRVRLRAHAPQGDLGRLKDGLPSRIVGAADGWKDGIPARLALGLEADPTLRSHDLIAWPRLAEGAVLPGWARPGVNVLLEVQTSSGGGELAIPLAATIRDGLDTIFFRRDPADPDQVLRQIADLGTRDGAWVEVLTGVSEGDQVVVDGIYQLKLSGAGRAELGGHFHADGSFHAESDPTEGAK